MSEFMLEFEVSILIEQSPLDVSTYVADSECLPSWFYFVLDVRKTSGTYPVVGTTCYQMRKTDQQDLRIVGFDEARSFADESVPPS